MICCIILSTSWHSVAQENSSVSASHPVSKNDTLPLTSTSYTDRTLLNNRLFLYQSGNEITSAAQAIAAFKQGKFSQNTAGQVSFGFTNAVLWAVLPVNVNTVSNSQIGASLGTSQAADTQNIDNKTSLKRVIEIDNAWLDKIDVFFIKGNEIVRREALGDTEHIERRGYNARMPTVSYAFSPGETFVVFRFVSQDPMTIPVYLSNEHAKKTVMLENAYFYGFLYGALLILLVYNLVLFVYLRERKYLLYSCYLFAFTAFNFTYTGHGYWWFWGAYPSVQQWLMPALMLCYITAGVTFTIEFLNTKKYLPSLFAKRKLIYSGLLLLALIMLIYGNQRFAILAQLVILTSLSLWMLLIGILCYRNGNTLAKFFVPAILLGTGGATVSSLATWGVVPYSQWAFRGIELGMFLEMSLLSVSLGFNFKEVYKARLSAEFTSRVYPLTNLYNRRAFSQLVYPLWELGVRKKQKLAVVLIDLDWFKQINDAFGHDAGDRVLELVAKTIKERVRSSDLVFRWGGEEFLLFLPDTNLEEAKTLAETLRIAVEKETSQGIAKVTMSIGIASLAPYHQTAAENEESNLKSADKTNEISLHELIKTADNALYQAKQGGRNCVVAA